MARTSKHRPDAPSSAPAEPSLPKKHTPGATRSGRIVKRTSHKPLIVNKQTGFPTITQRDLFIERDCFWIYDDNSTIKGAERGAFAGRTFEKNELIGCFKGPEVYLLELEDGGFCYFRMTDGRVEILSSVSHVIWADCAAKCTGSKAEHRLIYGVQVEDNLRLMNHSRLAPCSRVETYINPRAMLPASEQLDEDYHLLKPNVPFGDSFAVASIANRRIEPTIELTFDYNPDGNDEVDFERMDECGPAELSDIMILELQNAARMIEPENSLLLRPEQEWLIQAAKNTENVSLSSMEEQQTSLAVPEKPLMQSEPEQSRKPDKKPLSD